MLWVGQTVSVIVPGVYTLLVKTSSHEKACLKSSNTITKQQPSSIRGAALLRRRLLAAIGWVSPNTEKDSNI